jgi:hypothetical protein
LAFGPELFFMIVLTVKGNRWPVFVAYEDFSPSVKVSEVFKDGFGA